MTRLVLSILRQAAEPLTSRDIALELLVERALDKTAEHQLAVHSWLKMSARSPQRSRNAQDQVRCRAIGRADGGLNDRTTMVPASSQATA